MTRAKKEQQQKHDRGKDTELVKITGVRQRAIGKRTLFAFLTAVCQIDLEEFFTVW